MKKSYHEHCQEERTEALKALTNARAKEQEVDNVVIRYFVTKFKVVVMSVPRGKLRQKIDKIREKGYEIESVDGKFYKNDCI